MFDMLDMLDMLDIFYSMPAVVFYRTQIFFIFLDSSIFVIVRAYACML